MLIFARVLGALLAPIVKTAIFAAVIGILATTVGFDPIGMIEQELMDWFWQLAS